MKDQEFNEETERRSEENMRHLARLLAEERVSAFDQIDEKSDEIVVPPELTKKVFDQIQIEDPQKIPYTRSKGSKKLIRAAVVLLAIVLTSSILMVTNADAFKRQFQRLFSEEQEGSNQLLPKGASEENNVSLPEDWRNVWYLKDVPEGYTLTKAFEDYDERIILYENTEHNLIKFRQWPAEGATVHLDNEGDDFGEVTIKGLYDGYWTESDGNITLVWLQEDMFMSLNANMPVKDMIQIAESLGYLS